MAKYGLKVERPTILMLALLTIVLLLVGILIGIGVLSPSIISYGTVFGSLIVLGSAILFFEEIKPAFKQKKNLTSVSSIITMIIAVAGLLFGVLTLFGSVQFLESLRWVQVLLEVILLGLVSRSLFT